MLLGHKPSPLIKHFLVCTLIFSENVASAIDLGSKFKNDTVAHVAHVFAVGSGNTGASTDAPKRCRTCWTLP